MITDSELKRLYAYLDKAEAEGLEHPFIILAVRLQFEFAARMSENSNGPGSISTTGASSGPIARPAAYPSR